MTAQLALAVETPAPTPVKREDVARSIRTTGVDGLRWHAARNLCPLTRSMCAEELHDRTDRKATA